MNDIERFLQTVFGAKPESSWILIWTLPGKRSAWFRSVPEALAYVESLQGKGKDIYYGIGVSPKNYGSTKRCEADSILAIPGLWADIDIKNAVHKKESLSPDEDTARAILTAPGLSPSVIIHSGHGLQGLFLFREWLTFTTPEERAKAAALSEAWQQTLGIIASARGLVIDSVGDLSRVLRVPGTTNYKDRKAPVESRVLEWSNARVNPSDFEAVLLAPEPGAQKQSPAEIVVGPLILAPDAQPPFDLFQALLDNNTKFRQSWEAKRADRNFPSASEYEMSLLSLAAQAQWTDQQLADLAIAFRRKQAVDLKLNERRYQNEIRKARATAGQVLSPDGASYQEIEDSGAKEAEAPSPPEDLLAQLSSLLLPDGWYFVELLRLELEEPQYRWVVAQRSNGERREVNLGNAHEMRLQSRVQDAVYAVGLTPFADLPRKVWKNACDMMLPLWQAVSLGAEANVMGRVETWVKSYLSRRPIVRDWKEALKQETKYPYVKEKDLYINVDDLSKWLRAQYQERLPTSKLCTMLRDAGCNDTRHSFRDGDGQWFARSWHVPGRMVPLIVTQPVKPSNGSRPDGAV